MREISITRSEKWHMGNARITLVEYTEFDTQSKCHITTKMYVGGWFSRESTLIKKIKEKNRQEEQAGRCSGHTLLNKLT